MNQSTVEWQTCIILQIAREDGDYQAILRLCKSDKAYLRKLASELNVEVKGKKLYLAKAILSAMKKEVP